MADVAQNLDAIRAALRRAESDFGREPGSVSLVAISKTCGAELIRPALAAGQRVFGENYVQETAGKWPALREEVPEVELHLVGPLQSNKAREALRLFDVIHSLDRPSLAAALAKELPREFDRSGRQPRLLVQVNTGEEPQKAGIVPAETDAFIDRCRAEYGLSIAGLMCIPPPQDLPSPHFALLRTIAERNGLPLLSMGMSADFEAGIQLGATHVRVGTAIFGARAATA
jgi:pyridoxal phosphate enzyme (YggS family)